VLIAGSREQGADPQGFQNLEGLPPPGNSDLQGF